VGCLPRRCVAGTVVSNVSRPATRDSGVWGFVLPLKRSAKRIRELIVGRDPEAHSCLIVAPLGHCRHNGWVCFLRQVQSKEPSGFDLALFCKPQSNLKDLVALIWVCFGFVFYVKSLILIRLVALFALLSRFLLRALRSEARPKGRSGFRAFLAATCESLSTVYPGRPQFRPLQGPSTTSIL
jgi:hypothetical protein